MATQTQSENPVISGAGTATFEAPNYCTWDTSLNSTSTLTISNPSRANTLKFTIGGCPDDVKAYVGDEPVDSPNGLFKLLPNMPDVQYTATGDFKGQQVTITNITDQQNNADAEVEAQTTPNTTPA